MFPKIDFDYFVVNVELPVGSTLDKSKKVVEETERIIAQIPELDNYVTSIGSSASLGYGVGGSSGSNLGSIYVNLIDGKIRDRTSYEIAESMRSKLKSIQGAIVRAEELSAGPPTGAPIEVRVIGEDLKDMTKIISEITLYFENIPGVINIKDSIDNAPGEFVFTIDKQKANFYGLSVISIASNLRTAIHGIEATEVSLNGDDVNVVVKYDKDSFTNVNDLNNLLVITPSGENIPLKEIAEVKFEPTLLSIGHRDGDRIVSVTADVEMDVNIPKITAELEEVLKNMDIPDGVSVKVGGEAEEIEKSFREIFLSLIVAVLLIAIILVLQFNSFKQPFIIIFSLPLALIGVIFGLTITGQAFGLPVFIGIVSLAGIVVNDAIVLIDRINKNIGYGMEFYEAIIEGGTARMQPIFLTSITTIAGIAPLIYADELWRGLSLTVIFGLIFSTVLILVMVPIFYASICRNEKCETN
jgi:HAE1 family hydrophobic/amphiphilic exporter-1